MSHPDPERREHAPPGHQPARRPHARAGPGRHGRHRPAAPDCGPRGGQDPHPHPPDRVSARVTGASPTRSSQSHSASARPASCACASRTCSGRNGHERHRRDVPLGLRAAAARARAPVRPHRAVHDLRPGRYAAGDRLDPLRPRRATVQEAMAACGQPGSAEVQTAISLAKNQLLDPTPTLSVGDPAAPLIAAVWRESERELAVQMHGISTTCSRSPCGCFASTPSAAVDPLAVAVAARRRVPGHEPRPGRAGRAARRPEGQPDGRRRR